MRRMAIFKSVFRVVSAESKKKKFWLLCLQEHRCRYILRYDDEKNNCIYVLEGTSYVYGPYDMLS